MRDIDPQICNASDEEGEVKVKSSKPIPFFPLPLEVTHKIHRLSAGLEHWPSEIHPEQDLLDGTCFCEKKNKWIEKKIGNCRIFTPSTIITKTMVKKIEKTIDNEVEKEIEKDIEKEITVFAGKTTTCKCVLSPDCQSLALINVDNKNFVAYSTLTLFHSILGHGSPSVYLFTNILKSTYSWSSAVECLSFSGLYKIIRPG